jgi:hypothetical protein
MNKSICHLYKEQDEGRHQGGTRGGKPATQLAPVLEIWKKYNKLENS